MIYHLHMGGRLLPKQGKKQFKSLSDLETFLTPILDEAIAAVRSLIQDEWNAGKFHMNETKRSPEVKRKYKEQFLLRRINYGYHVVTLDPQYKVARQLKESPIIDSKIDFDEEDEDAVCNC